MFKAHQFVEILNKSFSAIFFFYVENIKSINTTPFTFFKKYIIFLFKKPLNVKKNILTVEKNLITKSTKLKIIFPIRAFLQHFLTVYYYHRHLKKNIETLNNREIRAFTVVLNDIAYIIRLWNKYTFLFLNIKSVFIIFNDKKKNIFFKYIQREHYKNINVLF